MFHKLMQSTMLQLTYYICTFQQIILLDKLLQYTILHTIRTSEIAIPVFEYIFSFIYPVARRCIRKI